MGPGLARPGSWERKEGLLRLSAVPQLLDKMRSGRGSCLGLEDEELVLQCCDGAELLDLVVEILVESHSCHAGSLGKVLLASLAMLAFSGVEVLPDGCLSGSAAGSSRIS